MAGGGKFLLMVAADGEFCFGDGFFHNIAHVSQTIVGATCLIPLLPSVAILYAKPAGMYKTYPGAFSIALTAAEIATVNEITQIYSKDFVFFRDRAPAISDHFRRGEHLALEYDKSPWVTSLCEAISRKFVANARDFDSEDGSA